MLHPRLPYLFKDTIVLSLTLTEFLQASDDSFRLKLLELDRNYDILTYCLQNNRSASELIQHISETSAMRKARFTNRIN